MLMQIGKLRIKFIAKLGAMGKYQDGKDKFHIIIPKQYIDQIKKYTRSPHCLEMDNEI